MINFQQSPPLLIKHINNNRIIIVTKYRIIFMSIINADFHIVSSTLLIQPNPLQLQYSTHRDQAIIITQSSIQVYSCGFVQQQIQLKKCIILNDQPVYSIRSIGMKKWQVFGQIYQYSNNFININSIESRVDDQCLSSSQQVLMTEQKCFVQQFQIYVCYSTNINSINSSSKDLKLYIYDHIKEVEHSICLKSQTIQQYLVDYLKSKQQSSTTQKQKQTTTTRKKLSIKGYKLLLSSSSLQTTINHYQKHKQNYFLSFFINEDNRQQYRSQLLPSPKFSSSIKTDAQSIVENNSNINTNRNNNNLTEINRKSQHNLHRHFQYSLTNNNKYENYHFKEQQKQQQQFILLIQIDGKYIIGLIPPTIINDYDNTKGSFQSNKYTKSNKNILSNKLSNQNNYFSSNHNIPNQYKQLINSNKWQAISIPLSKHLLQQFDEQLRIKKDLFKQTILFSSIYNKHFNKQNNKRELDILQELNINNNNNQQSYLCLLTKVQQSNNEKTYLFHRIRYQIEQNHHQYNSQAININNNQEVNNNQKAVKNKTNRQQIPIFYNRLLTTQTYQIQLSQSSSQSLIDITSYKQFLQMLEKTTHQYNHHLNRQQSNNNNNHTTNSCFSPPSFPIELTNIQIRIQNNRNNLSQQQQQHSMIQLTFVYYNFLNKNKTLSTVKLLANKILISDNKPHQQYQSKQFNVNNVNANNNHNQNMKNNSMKNTTSIIIQSPLNYDQNKLSNNCNNQNYHGKGLFSTSSCIKVKDNSNYNNNKNNNRQHMMLQNVPLTISQSITQSRPITTTTSQPITVALTYSSSNPNNSQLTNTQILSQKPSTFSNNSSNQNDGLKRSNSNEIQIVSLQLSNNPSNNLQFQHEQHITKHIEKEVNQLRIMDYLTPHHMPIPQLSQQQYNEQTTKFQMQQIQQIVEMKDFKPTQFIITNKSDNNKNNNKMLLSQSQNQTTQQKQFYQKFINHIAINNNNIININNNNNNNNNDSYHYHQQSFDTNFKQSKASVNNEQLRTNNITKMIGGKDISQIVTNLKNLSLNTDQQLELQQSITTVELGQEIEKKYSINYGVKQFQNAQQQYEVEQGYKQKEYLKHSLKQQQHSFLQCDQPTVILIDNLSNQQHQMSALDQRDIIHQNYSNNYNNNFIQQPHNDFNDPNYPNTPGFNVDFHSIDYQHILRNPQIGIVSNDHWDNFTKKWSAQVTQRVNECQELQNLNDDSPQHVSLNDSEFYNNKMKQSTKKVLTKQEFNNLSRKVKQFCTNLQNLTLQESKQIQNKKYTLLMKQIYIKSQQKFNYLLREFLAQIIRQQEARLLFAEYIRSFSGKTRDILIRLYMSLPQSQENKHFMSRALSEFKLSQVPQICLPINKDVLQIFKYLYPAVYIEDLLKPSIGLLQQLLQSYFSLQKLPVDQIIIEDEMIDLSHPRNMLNVLLYLNEHYNLPMTQLFETYCSVLVKNDCSQIIVKMLRQQKTFQICEVPKSILEDIVENIIVEKLKQSSSNIHWVQKTLQILQCNISPMSIKKKQRLSSILNLMDYLNLSDCQYNINTLFLLSEMKNLFIFCNTLIKQNSIVDLKKISLQKLYQQLYQITHDQKLIYYNQQLKDLIEILCEKYFLNGQVIKGFQILAPIISISRRGFLGKMLFKYLDGRWLNRLVKREFHSKQEFMATFKQCFTVNNTNGMNLINSQQRLTMSHNPRTSRQSNKNTNTKYQPSSSITLLPHDKFQFQPSKSYLTPNCSYFKFLNIYNECIKSIKSQQVMYVCYLDYQLAQQLATYHVIPKKQWQLLNQKLQPFIPKEEIKKLSLKSNFVIDNKLLIPQQQHQNQQEDNHLKLSHSENMKDPLFLNPINQLNSHQHRRKSLQSMDHQQPASKRNLNTKKLNVLRSKSHSKQSDQNFEQIQNIPLLESLQYEVNPQTIIKILRQLYEDQNENHNQKMKNFLKALSMIDRQRVHIHHYEKFKLIANLQLDFKFDGIIPFDVFLEQDHGKCFQIIEKNGLRQKLYLHNFWAIYMIVEMLISHGENVALLMIEKLMKQKTTNELQRIIEKIEGTKISPQKLKKIGRIS